MSATARRGCEVCDHTGWVCEIHPTKPWRGRSTRADACDCGAGTLCRCAVSANETLDQLAERVRKAIAYERRPKPSETVSDTTGGKVIDLMVALKNSLAPQTTDAAIDALVAAVRERDAEIARLKAQYGCKRHGLLPAPMCWKCVNEQEAAEAARAEP